MSKRSYVVESMAYPPTMLGMPLELWGVCAILFFASGGLIVFLMFLLGFELQPTIVILGASMVAGPGVVLAIRAQLENRFSFLILQEFLLVLPFRRDGASRRKGQGRSFVASR